MSARPFGFRHEPGSSPGPGNVAPLRTEQYVEGELEVDGAIPPALEGLLVRNGPNPAFGRDAAVERAGVGHDPERPRGSRAVEDLPFADPPFDDLPVDRASTAAWCWGDGMLHAIELVRGRAVAYRNRWVRTRKLAESLQFAPPRGPRDPIDGPANANVVWHGGRLLAMGGSGLPYRLSTSLETQCVEDFDADLTSPMGAHPRTDPDSGGLVFIGDDRFGPPYLRYHELDAQGVLVHTAELDTPLPACHCDFAVTATRIVLFDLPLLVDEAAWGTEVPAPARWDPAAGARLGVLNRGARGSAVRWLAIDPCHVSHVMNAYDDGESIVIDLCRYERPLPSQPYGHCGAPGIDPHVRGLEETPRGLAAIANRDPRPERWQLDGDLRALTVTQLDDRRVELPRVDSAVVGRRHRYAYCAQLGEPERPHELTGLVRYDFQRDEAGYFDPGPGCQPGEPVFVRAPDGHADDEGWVLCIVYDPSRAASDLVVLDATRFTGPPEAVVHLPGRVPAGLHGNWMAAERYR